MPERRPKGRRVSVEKPDSTGLRPVLGKLWDGEAAVRSDAMRTIVQASRAAYDQDVIKGLAQALDHDHYEIQEWAANTLSRCRGDASVVKALWESFRTGTRHSARSCALIALGHLGECLPEHELLALYRERQAHPKDLILESAIRWAGANAGTPGMLLALREIRDAEAQLDRREPKLENTLANAMLRCARRALADGKVTKRWLKDHGFDAVLGKLRETRAEKLIAEEIARRSQPSLPDLEPDREDTPLIANLPLPEAVEAQYVQDLVEFRNVRIREQRSIVRDQQLARHAKEKAAYQCQICRDRIEDPIGARRFVQAHHVEPLSEFGSDTAENVVVLCPSCHARLHAGEIK